ncbi:MAG TPA: fibronectin type III domain-containing protein [Acidimicrobiia bacterium]|nr:fibronectin type III domain-containing protein [Acidimicrobiia bacterium]
MAIATALLAATMPASAQAAAEPQAIINASGGDAGEPGLRIHYGNGQLQVYRDGNAQLYPGSEPNGLPSTWFYNAIALNLEGIAYTPAADMVPGFRFADTTQTGGSASGSGTIAGTLDTGVAGFVVAVTIDYTFPNEYFSLTLTIDGGTTTLPLKLYHFGLSQAYNYPGFHVATPPTVGIAAAGMVQAFRYRSGVPWTGYFSGYFTDAWNLIQTGSDFNDAISTNGDPKTYGIMWDLGTAAGAHSVSYEMVFSDALRPAADQMVAPTAVGGVASAAVTITAPPDNGSAITGYTVTGDPGGATCSIAAGETSCVVGALTNGIAYTFTATATNGNATSIASPPSNSVTPMALPPVSPEAEGVFALTFVDTGLGEMSDAASWLALQGIALGCKGGEAPRFCPDDLATRAEVATFLTRALGLPATAVDAFADDDGHLFEDNLNRAAAARVFLGCADGTVCPNAPITRGELAAVLVRALNLVTNSPKSFADSNDHWARSSVETVGGLGISIGCTADGATFCPEALGTRGEIAVLLYRALTLD